MNLKALGYLGSAISVLLLGIVDWLKAGDPQWRAWAVALGMATSIDGMSLRYLSPQREA